MQFACPRCKGSLDVLLHAYECQACNHKYPVICGIPDFRIYPDPYISVADDRRKGERLLEAAQGRTFEQLLRFYYSITPEVPPDHADRWVAHSLAQVDIAKETLRHARLKGSGALLDVGCSTGGLLAAAADDYQTLMGLDVAFRWLVVGQIRLRELGVHATLVCANAEALPFPATAFDAVTAVDVLEHVRDPQSALCEAARVSKTGGRMFCATNNRYAPLPDPQVGVWAVGLVPRRWQAAYVAHRRSGLHVYHVCMRSAPELGRLFTRAGYRHFHTEAAPLFAPHLRGKLLPRLLQSYNSIRDKPVARNALRLIAPRIMTLAER